MRADPVSSPSRLASLIPRFLHPGIKRLIGYEALRQRRSYATRGQQRLTRHPRLLTEKIVYKMAHDRRPILSTFADKVAVRDFVAERVGPDILTRVLAVADSASAIDWANLPEEYVAKASHGSGGNVVVSDSCDPTSELPERPAPGRWGGYYVTRDNADPVRLRALFAEWLSLDYAESHRYPVVERCYDGIPPRILIEEYLRDASGFSPPDFKLTMFNGRCQYIQVESDRMRSHHRDTMSPAWERLDVAFIYQQSPTPPPRPATLDRMIAVAEALSRDVDLLRVDLYSVEGQVRFGELTNFPALGRARFNPPSFDRKMGRRLKLDDYG